jgi:hypothetical protein
MEDMWYQGTPQYQREYVPLVSSLEMLMVCQSSGDDADTATLAPSRIQTDHDSM